MTFDCEAISTAWRKLQNATSRPLMLTRPFMGLLCLCQQAGLTFRRQSMTSCCDRLSHVPKWICQTIQVTIAHISSSFYILCTIFNRGSPYKSRLWRAVVIILFASWRSVGHQHSHTVLCLSMSLRLLLQQGGLLIQRVLRNILLWDYQLLWRYLLTQISEPNKPQPVSIPSISPPFCVCANRWG